MKRIQRTASLCSVAVAVTGLVAWSPVAHAQPVTATQFFEDLGERFDALTAGSFTVTMTKGQGRTATITKFSANQDGSARIDARGGGKSAQSVCTPTACYQKFRGDRYWEQVSAIGEQINAFKSVLDPEQQGIDLNSTDQEATFDINGNVFTMKFPDRTATITFTDKSMSMASGDPSAKPQLTVSAIPAFVVKIPPQRLVR